MTDLKEHIATVRTFMHSGGIRVEAIMALEAIEAVLFPTPGPALDPTKQFVVGEWYEGWEKDGGVECLYIFPNGSMGYFCNEVAHASGPFGLDSAWQHVPRNPELEAAKAERDAAAARLAEMDARVKELEGQ